ncbi:MAG: hypothetical protein ABIG67_02255 [Pseudomonadota bacterium]
MTPLREHPVPPCLGVTREIFKKEMFPYRFQRTGAWHSGFIRSCPVRAVSQKKIPPPIAVTSDLRVWATDALAEWITSIKQRFF